MPSFKTLCFIFSFFTLLSHSFSAYADSSPNRYIKERNERSTSEGGIPVGYREVPHPVFESGQGPEAYDNHVRILSWNSEVPLQRVLASIQEGVTNQLTLLKLFSAPNIITRSPQEKETWIYNWIWSYGAEHDIEHAFIRMDHPGKRIRKNRNPVSISVSFNDQDIVESYSVRFLKNKRDSLNDR